MKKLLVVCAVVTLAAGPVLAAGGEACCSNDQVKQTKNEMSCVSFASLNLKADQKAKLEAAQADCMKAGCTEQSHAKFLQQAKGFLSAEQYATLKKECGSAHKGKAS
jgi:hypothetical protein